MHTPDVAGEQTTYIISDHINSKFTIIFLGGWNWILVWSDPTATTMR